MPLLAVFAPESLTIDQYDEVVRQLEKAGHGKPQGRLVHICHGTGNQVQVTEVWDSVEHFQQFGQVLMPIAQQVGVIPGEPQISPIHNRIDGA